MNVAPVEYVERVGQMADDELQRELLKLNSAIEMVVNKAAARPLYARRRVAEAFADVANRGPRWINVSHEIPDADELVLTINARSESYSLCNWDGENWEDANTCELRTVTHWMRLDGVLAPPTQLALAAAGGAR